MVPAAIACLLLSGFTLWAPLGPVAPVWVVLATALGALVAAVRGGLRPALLILLVGLPTAWSALTVKQVLADRWPADRAGTDLEVTGSLCEFPRQQPGSWRFVLISDSVSRELGAPARLLVSWYDSVPFPDTGGPQPGETWQLNLRLRPPRGLANPGGFDFERWLFSREIGATAWVRAGDNQQLEARARGCRAARVRAHLARTISAGLGDRPAVPYILGLAIGASQALPASEWDILRRTGTVHLISISGFHVSLVAVPATFLGVGLGWLLLRMGVSVRPRVVAACFAMLAGTGYGALAGFSIPTQRAVVGLIAVSAALTWGRQLSVSGLLALVVVVLLLLEPLGVLAPGFWLSFAGVAILAVVALGARRLPATGPQPGAVGRLLVRPVQLLLLTQLAVTVGMAPLLVLFFGQLPLTGTLANLVAIPAFSLVLLPLTLTGAALAGLDPDLGLPVLRLAAACVDLWRAFATWCAGLPVAMWHPAEPSPLALCLALVGVSWALWPRPVPARYLAPALLSSLLFSPAAPVPAGGLRVQVLDVGQGLSVLVSTARHHLLYDAGPAFRNSDAGERVVVPVLQSLGIRHLDTLMISHPDADHRGGAATVLESFPMARVLGSGPPADPGQPCVAGMAWHWDGFDFELLHPVAGTMPRSRNAGSCVLVVSGPGARVLLPGDIDAPVERDLLARGAIDAADLVLVPHHGSRTSSTEALVKATRPRYAVFATGFGNRWKFPRPDVVDRWAATGACLLDTADEGAIRFELVPGGSLRVVRRERRAARGIWWARSPVTPSCT